MRLHFIYLFAFILTLIELSEAFKNKTWNGKKRIRKCCLANQYVTVRKRCAEQNNVLDFADLHIYNESILDTGKFLLDVFDFIPNAFSKVEFEAAIDTSYLTTYKLYLTESGNLYLDTPNTYPRWTVFTRDKYCVDYKAKRGSSPTPRFFIILDIEEYPERSILEPISIYITTAFLILVLVVYSVLPCPWKLDSVIRVAFVASLSGADLLLSIILTSLHIATVCYVSTLIMHFCFLASFFWINIMFFDIWIRFSRTQLVRSHPGPAQFLIYSLYGFGLPLIMTILLGIVNEIDMKRLPWFITPKILYTGCFLQGHEKIIYLHIPMMISMIINWLIFLRIWHKICRAEYDKVLHSVEIKRFPIYAKLMILMTLYWVLELCSTLFPSKIVFCITDVYNILVGPAIFFIFVCNEFTLEKLCKRFPAMKRFEKMFSSKPKESKSTDGVDQALRYTPSPQVHCLPSAPLLPSCSLEAVNATDEDLQTGETPMQFTCNTDVDDITKHEQSINL